MINEQLIIGNLRLPLRMTININSISMMIFFICWLLGMSSCASSMISNKQSHLNSISYLTTGSWQLISVRENTYSEFIHPFNGKTLSLQINPDGKYSGFDGCNNFYGQCKFSKDSIIFDSAVSTRRYCPDNGPIDRILHSAYEQITNYSIKEDKLILKNNTESYIIYER